MWNIVDVVGLSDLLMTPVLLSTEMTSRRSLPDLVADEYTELVATIDADVFDYFASLDLPEKPTLYDHLVRSLRNKDIIATFNWDPFLVQAIAGSGDPKQRAVLHCFCTATRPLGIARTTRLSVWVVVEATAIAAVNLCRTAGCSTRSERRSTIPTRSRERAGTYFGDRYRRIPGHDFRIQCAPLRMSKPLTAPENEAWGSPASRDLEEIEIIDVKGEGRALPNVEIIHPFSPLPDGHKLLRLDHRTQPAPVVRGDVGSAHGRCVHQNQLDSAER